MTWNWLVVGPGRNGLFDNPITEIIKTAGSAGSSEFAYMEYLTLARLFLALGKEEDALQVIEPLLNEANRIRSIRRAIYLLVLKTLAFQQKKDLQRAVEVLEKTLDIAAPERYLQVFLDEGNEMTQLLHYAFTHGFTSPYAKKVMTALKQVSPAPVPDNKTPSDVDIFEPLSKRELEVLELIAAGLSNREICASLHLSLEHCQRAHIEYFWQVGGQQPDPGSFRGNAVGNP